jgi:hypothetical protein
MTNTAWQVLVQLIGCCPTAYLYEVYRQRPASCECAGLPTVRSRNPGGVANVYGTRETSAGAVLLDQLGCLSILSEQ